MKRKILISILLAPLATTTLATVSSCNSYKSNEKSSDPKTASYVTIKFLPKDEEEAQKITWSGSTTVRAKAGRQFCTVSTPLAYKNQYVVTYWMRKISAGKFVRIEDDYIIPDDGMEVYPYFENDIELGDCVGLSAIENSTVSIVNHGTTVPNISFSTNGITWTPYEEGQVLNISSGSVLYFRGNNFNEETGKYVFSTSETDYTSFSIGGSVSLTGNVMTLLDDGKGKMTEIPSDYCFYKLFEGCSGIVSISSNFLPATTLKKYCYAYMFSDCTRLTDFPKSLLPAQDLFVGSSEPGVGCTCCYAGMFMGCHGLKTVPKNLLNASKLSMYCYYGMFEGCSGIVELDSGIFDKADTLAYGCYCAMFSNCSNLKILGDALLPATKLAPLCYANMFSVCNALVDASNLELNANIGDATTEAYNCYQEMFYGCKNLEKAPNLPSTTTATSCYESMFYNCEALTDEGLPTIGATSLQPYCFRYMFYHCITLTEIPQLSVDVLATGCYYKMFAFCEKLGIEDALSTSWLGAHTLAPYCYYGMFQGCEAMTTAPSFPDSGNVTLADSCCRNMYQDCVALTVAHMLPTNVAADYCYAYMYSGCEGIISTDPIILDTFPTVSDVQYGKYACAYLFNGCVNLDIRDDTTQTGDPSEDTPWAGPYQHLIIDPTALSNVAEGAFERVFQETKTSIGSGGPADWYFNQHKWGYNDPQ